MEMSTEMAGRDHTPPFSMQKAAPVQQQQPQPQMPGMRLGYAPDGTAVYITPAAAQPQPPPSYHPVGGNGSTTNAGATDGNGSNREPHGLGTNAAEPVKKKRGRPRKYGPDGALASGMSPSPLATPAAAAAAPVAANFSTPSTAPANPAPPSASADGTKKRGRPKGSTNKQHKQPMPILGSAGIGFAPHVITVKAGEDVSAKILSVSQHGSYAVCVLSANGAISHVTLRQAATSGGTVTYEGRFEILSLSGSFLVSENGGQRSRTGGLSVSLAGPDGRLLGGGVAGLLTAAAPVQVVVGSFIPDGSEREPKQPVSTDPAAPAAGKLNSMGPAGHGAGSPPSRGTLSESSGRPGSPLNQSTGAFQNNQLGLPSLSWK